MRASTLAIAWMLFYLVADEVSTRGDANIGLGLLAFGLLLVVAGIWGVVDGSRHAFPQVAITWGSVAVFMGVMVPVFTALTEAGFSWRVLLSTCLARARSWRRWSPDPRFSAQHWVRRQGPVGPMTAEPDRHDAPTGMRSVPATPLTPPCSLCFRLPLLADAAHQRRVDDQVPKRRDRGHVRPSRADRSASPVPPSGRGSRPDRLGHLEPSRCASLPAPCGWPSPLPTRCP